MGYGMTWSQLGAVVLGHPAVLRAECVLTAQEGGLNSYSRWGTRSDVAGLAVVHCCGCMQHLWSAPCRLLPGSPPCSPQAVRLTLKLLADFEVGLEEVRGWVVSVSRFGAAEVLWRIRDFSCVQAQGCCEKSASHWCLLLLKVPCPCPPPSEPFPAPWHCR